MAVYHVNLTGNMTDSTVVHRKPRIKYSPTYIGHIYVPNVAYISPISVPYFIKIKVIFQLLEIGEKFKKSDPPPQSKLVYI